MINGYKEWLLYLFRLVIRFLSYQPLMTVVLTSVSFLIIGWINISNGELTIGNLPLFITALKLLGLNESGVYGNKEIMDIFFRLSLLFGGVGLVLDLFLKKVLGIKLRFGKRWVFVGVTVLFVFSLLSCFSANAKANSISIAPVLFIFWMVAMIALVWYLFLEYLLSLVGKMLGASDHQG